MIGSQALQPYIFQDELNRSGTIPIITYRAKDLWQRMRGYRGKEIADYLGIDEAYPFLLKAVFAKTPSKRQGLSRSGSGNILAPASTIRFHSQIYLPRQFVPPDSIRV